ncbi:hypothetical protein [Nocardia macrotermitis]|uniref:Uncharacterized protein n=1 Tax=Nocardia macrotermitis TaxID=2585198 RepID=A0A7K0D9F6_9NOCA|nr:hypothetical protein [Nocardia macrotermitis]MQY22357.1 hypothetical protein [Nocardia macrotermitis]
MPHDATAPEPVPLTLSMPSAPPAGLTDGLVRPLSEVPGAPLLDAAAPDVEVAEFLVVAAHSVGGFVARVDSGARAVGVVAATVAALCGEDIRRALTHPDVEFLRGLAPAAVEALRGVLLAIESETPDVIAKALEVLQTPSPPATGR